MSLYPSLEWLRTKTFWQLSLAMAAGTFVDWSVNFLLGKKNNHVVYSQHKFHGIDLATIPDNPLIINNGTAHHHQRNHPYNIGDLLWYTCVLHDMAPNDLHTFFFCQPSFMLHHHPSPENQIYQQLNYQAVGEFFLENTGIPHVVVYSDFDSAPYIFYRFLRTHKKIQTMQDLKKSDLFFFTDWCFKNSDSLKKTISFSFSKYHQGWRKHIEMQNHLCQILRECIPVSISDIFLRLDSTMIMIFDKMPHLKLQQKKIDQWLVIYRNWQNLNQEFKWFLTLSDLTKKIIQGDHVEFEEIDDLQHLAISAELLIQGWHIKTKSTNLWPKNTKDLDLIPVSYDSLFVNG